MAACAECGTALPRGATACPSCGAARTPAPRTATKPAANGAGAAATAAKRPAKAAGSASAKAAGSAATKPPAKGAAGAAKPTAKPPAKSAAGRGAVPLPTNAVAVEPAPPAPKALSRTTPVVKAVATPVTPAVKSGSPPVTPRAKATSRPTTPAVKTARRSPGITATRSAPGDEVTAAPAAARARRTAAPRTRPAPEQPVESPPWSAYVEAPAEPAADRLATDPTAATPAGAAPPVTAPPLAPVALPRSLPGDVVGEADERDPNAPVVPFLPKQLDLPQTVFLPDAERRPLPLRLLRGDWLGVLLTALPAFGLVLVLASLCTWATFQATDAEGDALFGSAGDGRWGHYFAATVGAMFGAPVRVTQGINGGSTSAPDELFEEVRGAVFAVPLTVTLLVLAVLWWLVRRRRVASTDRAADAIRIATVFAAGVGAVTAFSGWAVPGKTDFSEYYDVAMVFRFSVSPWKAMAWAFAAAFVVAWLARTPLDPPERWSGWVAACRSALVGLGVGVVGTYVVSVMLAYSFPDRIGATSDKVTNGLPLSVAIAVNLGVAGFGVVSGGQVQTPFAETTTFSVFADAAPGSFLLLLAIPALAVAAGLWWALRRENVALRDLARVGGRMAAPATLAWLALAVVGTVRAEASQGAGFVYGGAIGAVLWDAVLVGLWFGAGGWVGGVVGRRVLERSFDRRAEPPVPS